MVLHSRDDNRNSLFRGIPEDVLVHLFAQRIKKMPGPMSGSSTQNDDLRGIDMDGTYQQPTQVPGPMLQFVEAKPVIAGHRCKHCFTINGTGICKVPVSEN